MLGILPQVKVPRAWFIHAPKVLRVFETTQNLENLETVWNYASCEFFASPNSNKNKIFQAILDKVYNTPTSLYICSLLEIQLD
jgi:hypothetical protein